MVGTQQEVWRRRKEKAAVSAQHLLTSCFHPGPPGLTAEVSKLFILRVMRQRFAWAVEFCQSQV